MPTNILLVEREKEIKENRIANNMRQEVIAAKSQVFSVEKEKKAKSGFVDNETKLQKLAAAEKARREAAKAEQEAQKKMNKSVKPPPSAKSDASSRPPTGKPELEKVCTVVKVHEDGSVDLRLSNGEVVERIDPSKLERAGERPPTAQSEKPPPTASSRPPTGRISSRWTEETKAAATKAVTFAPPSTADSSSSKAPIGNLTRSNLSNREDGQLDLAMMEHQQGGRRGGRRTIGAQAASQSEIASALSWQ